MVQLLYERAYEFCLAKHNIKIDIVHITGEVYGVKNYNQCGCWDEEAFLIPAEELNNTDYDIIREERITEETRKHQLFKKLHSNRIF